MITFWGLFWGDPIHGNWPIFFGKYWGRAAFIGFSENPSDKDFIISIEGLLGRGRASGLRHSIRWDTQEEPTMETTGNHIHVGSGWVVSMRPLVPYGGGITTTITPQGYKPKVFDPNSKPYRFRVYSTP